MQLFYCKQIIGDRAFLSADETRHLKVTRKSVGERIDLVDGLGHLIHAELLSIQSNGSELKVLELIEMTSPRSYHFHLFIAPTKQNERIEWMLEKAVESGLDEITFIETEHSEKHRIKLERLEKIAISAMKQSGQFRLPLIHDIKHLKDIQFNGFTCFAHCREDQNKMNLFKAIQLMKNQTNINICIGPEGDFSVNEIKSMNQMGAQAIALGPTRLRTETAGLYCAIALNALS